MREGRRVGRRGVKLGLYGICFSRFGSLGVFRVYRW